MAQDRRDAEQKTPTAVDRVLEVVLERNHLNRRLHWTTIVTEKTLLAIIGML
ncbi:MAG: hypothetical protein HN856_04225, partial [Gammaproteobacteria bacterium]|nr:hypothetical protein [Gammaproteobacteria bacterium]